MSKRLMVIDALNAYFRAYIVNPSLSESGEPIGGYKGFIKIIQKLCRELEPDEVIIAWDGAGGSQKRKATNKNYKEGRKPIRLNRAVRTLTEDQEMQNKVWQQHRLMEMLNQMPFIQLVSDGIEADDIISYVVQYKKYNGWQKIIVSSDKDFFQLCDDETILYRPMQKEDQKMFVNKPRILKEFGIHPTNFAMARAIAGDKSDNLDGVRGVGLKTIANKMQFFANEKPVTFSDIYEHCENDNTGLKVFTSILESKSTIQDNYKIMQLYSPAISIQTKNKIQYALDNFEPHFNKTEVLTRMKKDGFGTLNMDSLFTRCKRISSFNNKTEV
jgi:DNA polymerase I